MTLAPRSRTDARLALQMSTQGALRLLTTDTPDPFPAAYFLTIVRMLDWMTHCGGYPVHERRDSMYAVENVNKICMELVHDGRFDFIKMREHLLLLTDPSPFAVDDEGIANIKLFLTELTEKLQKDRDDNSHTGFGKRFI